MFYILENCLNYLPLEILERIFKLVLASSTYEWPNHIVNNYNSLTAVDSFYKIAFCKIGYHYLPRIYIAYPDNLPKAINGIRTVSVQRMIRLFGSFSGVMTEPNQIINDKLWNTAWGMLAFYGLLLKTYFGKRSKKALRIPYFL